MYDWTDDFFVNAKHSYPTLSPEIDSLCSCESAVDMVAELLMAVLPRTTC